METITEHYEALETVLDGRRNDEGGACVDVVSRKDGRKKARSAKQIAAFQRNFAKRKIDEVVVKVGKTEKASLYKDLFGENNNRSV
jgi:hypothetical protein